MQNAFRPGKSRVVANQDFPAAMDAGTAKGVARDKLWSLFHERSTAKLHAVLSSRQLFPGSLVSVEGSPDLWRVRSHELAAGAVELLLSKTGNTIITTTDFADQGRAVSDRDALAGQTRLMLVDLPFALDAPQGVSDVPRLYAAAAGGEGWRHADLFSAAQDGTVDILVGRIPTASVIGTSQQLLGVSNPVILDEINILEVQLHNQAMILNEADEAQLLLGKNAASIGNEVIQFMKAEPLGDTRYRLSSLVRGLGGTENEVDLLEIGEYFIQLQPESLLEIEPRHYAPFLPNRFLALGRDDEQPVAADIGYCGRAIKPW